MAMKKTGLPIFVEQTFDVSIDQLWAAITELDQMKQWFFNSIEAFEPRVGFETTFIVENEGRIFPHLWKITAVEPPKSITYNWQYEGYEGNSFVTFELSEQTNYSTLRLTHVITENFQKHIPEFQRESCLDGWKWFIKHSLRSYLKIEDPK